jgi:hypothetical protein
MPDSRPATVWVVVTVESGVPTDVQGFRDECSARAQLRAIRRELSEESDEAAAFAVHVD